MGNRPYDLAFGMLKDHRVTEPRVYREDCYICRDMEFARMGLPLCKTCCQCSEGGSGRGHIAADDTVCDDCEHEVCPDCYNAPAQQEEICTCDSPCCEVDVGIGIMTCGGYHCPTHGVDA